MKFRILILLLFSLSLGTTMLQAQPNPANPQDLREPYLSVITPELVKGHVFFLADDLLEGRQADGGQQGDF